MAAAFAPHEQAAHRSQLKHRLTGQHDEDGRSCLSGAAGLHLHSTQACCRQGAMFKRILVPLDGTPFGEAVLPMAETMAAAFKAEIFLLHVEEHPRLVNYNNDIVSWRLHNRDAASEAYLEGIVRRFAHANIPCSEVVLEGGLVRTILDCADDVKADLIIMATHGHSDIVGLFTSETATHVMRRAPIPILMLNEQRLERASPRP
jgi:nucleotide-binding universal stress UspA family protein